MVLSRPLIPGYKHFSGQVPHSGLHQEIDLKEYHKLSKRWESPCILSVHRAVHVSACLCFVILISRVHFLGYILIWFALSPLTTISIDRCTWFSSTNLKCFESPIINSTIKSIKHWNNWKVLELGLHHGITYTKSISRCKTIHITPRSVSWVTTYYIQRVASFHT